MWPFGGNNKQSEVSTTSAAPAFEAPQISAIPMFDASKLHPLAGLDKEIEYLELDEEKLNTLEGTGNGILPSRGWSDDLCYGTGACYMSGLAIGGFIGLNEGLKNLPAPSLDAKGKLTPAPFKLKLNTVLNNITKRGPFIGNSAGVLALLYNIIDSSLDAYRGRHDDLNSIVSGALAGAIFKSTAGLKGVAYSSGLMTLAAAAWCGFKRSIN